MLKNQKTKLNIFIFLIIILFIISGCVFNNKQETQNNNNQKAIQKNNRIKQKQISSSIQMLLATSTDETGFINTSDWRIYKTKVYSIKIPNYFKISEQPLAGEEDVLFVPPSSKYDPNLTPPISKALNIEYYSSKNPEILLELKKKSYFNSTPLDKITKELIDGIPAWTTIKKTNNVNTDNTISKTIIFMKDNYVFVISYWLNQDNNTEKIFNKIIQTFKFIK